MRAETRCGSGFGFGFKPRMDLVVFIRRWEELAERQGEKRWREGMADGGWSYRKQKGLRSSTWPAAGRDQDLWAEVGGLGWTAVDGASAEAPRIKSVVQG